jgi:hypothetical protein
MQHTQVVHGKDLLYYCKQCDVRFNGMEQMRDHAKKFHTYRKKLERQGQEQGQGQVQEKEKEQGQVQEKEKEKGQGQEKTSHNHSEGL